MAHAIHCVTRRLTVDQLPTVLDAETRAPRTAVTDQELLDNGIKRTAAPDVYDCCEQYRGPHTEALEPFGFVGGGELLSHGPDRFNQLPDDIKAQVLQAQIIRAPAPGAIALATASLADQTAAIAEHVGDDATIDVGTPADEAVRLAMIPDNSIEMITVSMSQVILGQDVVRQDSIEPHRWAGERLPTP